MRPCAALSHPSAGTTRIRFYGLASPPLSPRRAPRGDTSNPNGSRARGEGVACRWCYAGALVFVARPRGGGPPCAQSSSSTVWTIGIDVPPAICVMQPMLPVAMTSGRTLSMLADLAVAQAAGDLRLQDVVGAGRAAADVALGHVAHGEAGVGEQRLRLLADLLAVLHRAGGVVGDRQAVPAPLASSRSSVGEILGDVLGERRDAVGLARRRPRRPEHEAVVLDRRAAARRGDDDGVEALALDLARPGVDVGRAKASAASSRPMWWTSAPQQPSPFGAHDLDAVAVEQADGGGVDAGREHRSARSPAAARRARARPVRRMDCRRGGAGAAAATARAPASPRGGARPGTRRTAGGAKRPRRCAAAASAARKRFG